MMGKLDMDVINKLRNLSADQGEDLLGELAVLFLETVPEAIAEMQEASAGGDPEKLWRSAHSTKSSCGTLGALELMNIALEIETIGKGGKTDGAGDLIKKFESEFANIASELKTLTKVA